jgi:hypothetical protein
MKMVALRMPAPQKPVCYWNRERYWCVFDPDWPILSGVMRSAWVAGLRALRCDTVPDL